MRRSKNIKNNQFLEKVRGYLYIIVSIALIVSLIRNISRIRRAEERIHRATERVETLEKEKVELQTRLDESQSQMYLETQLRDGLGLAKEEEIVIVLPDEEVLRSIAPDIKDTVVDEPQLPVWRKWLALFTMLEE